MGQWGKFVRKSRGFLRFMQIMLAVLLRLYLCMYRFVKYNIFTVGLAPFPLAFAGFEYLLRKYRSWPCVLLRGVMGFHSLEGFALSKAGLVKYTFLAFMRSLHSRRHSPKRWKWTISRSRRNRITLLTSGSSDRRRILS